jgi:putative transposase
MSNRRRSQGVRAKYAFIKAYRGEFDTTVMCRLLDESRSGFYEWLRKPLSDRALEDQRWLGLIRVAHTASHGVYGAPRIFLDLREAGETRSKHRVARIMGQSHESPPRLTSFPVQQRPHVTPDAQYAATRVYRPTPEQGLGHRHYVCAHLGRLARSCRRDGPLLPPNCRLVNKTHDGPRTRAGRNPDGRTATQATAGTDSSDQGSQFGSDAWRRFCHAPHLKLGMSRAWRLLG